MVPFPTIDLGSTLISVFFTLLFGYSSELASYNRNMLKTSTLQVMKKPYPFFCRFILGSITTDVVIIFYIIIIGLQCTQYPVSRFIQRTRAEILCKTFSFKKRLHYCNASVILFLSWNFTKQYTVEFSHQV